MVGDVIVGRYELEELVGTGGMSSVYRAHDRLLERNVALKILHEQYTTDEEFVERFRREARAVAQLSHPNIVTVIDRGEDDGRQFIVFEYIDGENLKERLVRRGRLPVRDALELTLQVARALAFAHEHGLVHRDVKPQNVLLNGDGETKVTDFGIARPLDVDRAVTQAGTVLGTSDYIAPEQASGREVDAQTDVYSLGVVLYELLTGTLPFTGDNFVAVALKHVNEPPPSILDVRRDVPPRVAAAIDRALEKDPARRFPSMEAFAAELEACLAGHAADEDTLTRGPAVAAPPSRRRRKRVSPWAAGIALLALLAIAAVVVGFVALRGSGKHTAIGAETSIHLRGISGYDPFGDKQEHDDKAALATDGHKTTAWDTEHYFSFTKPGVGLLLDTGNAVTPHGITIDTDTPGFTAEIRSGASAGGRFHTVSPSQTINGETTLELFQHGKAEYYVVWITKLPPGSNHVDLNEVTAG